MSEFAAALRHLSAYDPTANISTIKGLISERLKGADDRAEVVLTDYFNHSFVPDMYLRWPSQRETRPVFLRAFFDEQDIRMDLKVHESDHPILMSLEAVPTEPSVPSAERQDRSGVVSATSRGSGTLVTDPYALEALEDSIAREPVVALFAGAVVQGGRGILGADLAEVASRQVAEGFSGARSADERTTSVAVEAAEFLLDGSRASQMNRLLHAVWVGGGADGLRFPASTGVTSALDARSLEFLLSLPDIDDPDFWARVSRTLTTQRASELAAAVDQVNFQRLMWAAFERLEGKACKLTSTDVPAGSWTIRGGRLALSIGRSLVVFAALRTNELDEIEAVASAPTTSQLAERAQQHDIVISEVSLRSGDRGLAYSSSELQDVSGDTEIANVVDALGSEFSVRSVVAQIGQSRVRSVKCDFGRALAAGWGPARYRLHELIENAVPLFAAISPEDLAAATSSDAEETVDTP